MVPHFIFRTVHAIVNFHNVYQIHENMSLFMRDRARKFKQTNSQTFFNSVSKRDKCKQNLHVEGFVLLYYVTVTNIFVTMDFFGVYIDLSFNKSTNILISFALALRPSFVPNFNVLDELETPRSFFYDNLQKTSDNLEP